jgi:hypothetical protein
MMKVAAVTMSVSLEESFATALPPSRRMPTRTAWQHARSGRGPTWSCAEAALVLAGRAIALAADEHRRLEALRDEASVLAALVREREISKPVAADRILSAGIAFAIPTSAINEILHAEFST